MYLKNNNFCQFMLIFSIFLKCQMSVCVYKMFRKKIVVVIFYHHNNWLNRQFLNQLNCFDWVYLKCIVVITDQFLFRIFNFTKKLSLIWSDNIQNKLGSAILIFMWQIWMNLAQVLPQNDFAQTFKQNLVCNFTEKKIEASFYCHQNF